MAGGPLAPQKPQTSRERVGPSATAGTPAWTFGHHECGPASSSGSGPCRCCCASNAAPPAVSLTGAFSWETRLEGFLCSRLPVPSKQRTSPCAPTTPRDPGHGGHTAYLCGWLEAWAVRRRPASHPAAPSPSVSCAAAPPPAPLLSRGHPRRLADSQPPPTVRSSAGLCQPRSEPSVGRGSAVAPLNGVRRPCS